MIVHLRPPRPVFFLRSTRHSRVFSLSQQAAVPSPPFAAKASTVSGRGTSRSIDVRVTAVPPRPSERDRSLLLPSSLADHGGRHPFCVSVKLVPGGQRPGTELVATLSRRRWRRGCAGQRRAFPRAPRPGCRLTQKSVVPDFVDECAACLHVLGPDREHEGRLVGSRAERMAPRLSTLTSRRVSGPCHRAVFTILSNRTRSFPGAEVNESGAGAL